MPVETTLYIIRHGIAADRQAYASDADRPLTDKGQRKTRKIAKQLKQFDIRFDLIQTSPLLRARQTAKILQDVGLGKTLEPSSHLAPEGSIHAWVDWLDTWRNGEDPQTLAIVGHQPNLGNWAEMLLWGNAKDSLEVKKASVIGLHLPPTGSPIGTSTMFWFAPPKFLLG